MKITKHYLKKIIKEETQTVLKEKAGFFGRMFGIEQEESAEAIKALEDFHRKNRESYNQFSSLPREKAETFIKEVDAMQDQYGLFQFDDATPDGDQRERINTLFDDMRTFQSQAATAIGYHENMEQRQRDQDERNAERARQFREEEAERESEAADLSAYTKRHAYGRGAHGREEDSPMRGGHPMHKDSALPWDEDISRLEESKMRISKSRLQKMIKEELDSLLNEKEEVGRKYADMSQEELINTMKSATYQKVYLFAKGELKKRGYEGEFPAPHSGKKKEEEA